MNACFDRSKIQMIRFKGETQQGQPSVTVLFARTDGMIVGGAQQSEGQFGENPLDVARRSFIDHESAVAWVKQQCKEYMGREDVDFSMRDAEPQIVLPRGPMPKVRM